MQLCTEPIYFGLQFENHADHGQVAAAERAQGFNSESG